MGATTPITLIRQSNYHKEQEHCLYIDLIFWLLIQTHFLVMAKLML